MSRLFPPRAISALLFIAIFTSGCGKDEEGACATSEDCDAGKQCASGACVATVNSSEGDMGNMSPDQGEQDQGGVNTMPGECGENRLMCSGRCCAQGFACDSGSCSCEQEQLCEGICCGAGETCELGQCVEPCEGQLCGSSLELCCEGAEICINGGCEVPGERCQFNEQCDGEKICEPLVGKCVTRPAERCEYKPPVGEFSPVIGCEWRPDDADNPTRGDVVAAPIVMDVADEGEPEGAEIPEIIFPSMDRRVDGCCSAAATIRIVSGKCDGEDMRTVGSITHVDVANDVGIAAGDLDGDGVPEIVAIGHGSRERPDGTFAGKSEGTYVFKRASEDGSQWETMWHNEDYPAYDRHIIAGAPTISIADLNGDGSPNIIIGSVVLDGASGELVWDGTAYLDGGQRVGQGHNVFGPVSSVLDVDNDGQSEVFAGNTLYDTNGDILWQYEFDSEASRCIYSANRSLACDGYNGVVDFDGDASPEVVSVRQGEIWVIDAATGELDWKAEVPWEDCVHPNNGERTNESGPPTVADFDGDGRPEIGTAGADFYAVADLDCDRDDWEAQGCHDRGILWATPNQDCSSRSTASSVFDFEGDGAAEVVYADEKNFFILSGKTGEVLFVSDDHQSNTRMELPVVADVDNDNNAEVIVASAWGNRLAESYGPRGKSGLRVWQDADDNWVRTRRVWNQHSYHVTNILEDGTVPSQEQPNWAIAGLNNYRQNVQPSGVFDAPDLVVRDLRVGDALCAVTGQLDVYLLLGNDGALGVPEGVTYSVWAVQGDRRELIAEGVTEERLLPGQTLSFTYQWSAPQSFMGQPFGLEATIDEEDAHKECREDNNARDLQDVECQLQG